ncbi:MAG: NUDIX hydrolase [Candidatus Blackburnbacteria bacterium]|nr:NUDIX hydrolase [Candidatus Blackburnbacteria bacterium]
MDKIILAGCVIPNDKGEVLLIHRNTAKRVQWETPGGKIEEGEDPRKTAEREAEEEIGVDIEIIKELGRKEFEEDTYVMDYIWYLTSVKSGEPQIIEKDKYDDLRYFPWEELREMREELSPNAKNLVDAYFAQEIILKTQLNKSKLPGR